VTREDEHAQLLRSKGLWPVRPDHEQDWSGRGEHLKLFASDKDFLDQTLKCQGLLGQSNSATVDSVKCRRIMLARKTISYNRHFTKHQAIEEVAHLKKLKHAHIVRVIGTYVLGRKLSILIYPVARFDLSGFLENMDRDTDCEGPEHPGMRTACRRFFSCLSSALEHIHSIFMKHMDIKPKNILVQKSGGSLDVSDIRMTYQVLIADFGIARSYTELNDTNTEGPTMFTRKYAAPEVASQEQRGLPADIFSLGCVFLEMSAALARSMPGYNKFISSLPDHNPKLTTEALQAHLEESPIPDSSYHKHIVTIRKELSDEGTWILYRGPIHSARMAKLIRSMLSEDPTTRPTADDLITRFPLHDCCQAGPAPLQAEDD
jgi:serine/threonine protein kinase